MKDYITYNPLYYKGGITTHEHRDNYINIELENWKEGVNIIPAKYYLNRNEISFQYPNSHLDTYILSFDGEIFTDLDIGKDFISMMKDYKFRNECFSEAMLETCFDYSDILELKKQVRYYAQDNGSLFLVRTHIKNTNIEVIFAYLDYK